MTGLRVWLVRGWLMIFLVTVLSPGAVGAQNPFAPALIVNDGVITNYDIAQRSRLLQALGAPGDIMALAREQLIEDRVKLQAASALGVTLPDGALEGGLDEFAAQRGLTVDDVLNVLSARQIDRQTMDDYVEAGLIWREVVTARFRARALPSDEEVDAALAMAESSPVEVFQMAEIALPFAERGEAETIALADRLYRELSAGGSFTAAVRQYSRSASAERDGLIDPIAAANLPPELRRQVLLLRPGQVTRPIPIGGGLAILRLISIEQRSPAQMNEEERLAQRERVREQIFVERITGFGEGYLQELLRDAIIIER
jgi:peptidyl-prolyl cis-trans isomerase SurA